jgi:predicted XRE-type DNA-binding protein
MKAEDASEMMDSEKSADKFKTRTAIMIAVLAALLAVTGLGGQNAAKEATNNNIFASNLYAFYQAKNIRQTSFALAADALEIELANPAASPETKTAIQKKIDGYRKNVSRYESEPDTNEGKKELLVRAKAMEVIRDHALKQDPYFDYAEVLLQIAIVLASVAIVSGIGWLVFGSALLGILGTLLMINGFLLLVAIPGIG